MAKHVLILGGKGMLGHALFSVFEKDYAWHATGIDRDEVDITDEASLRNAFEKYKPDVVINAAAYNAVDKCETDEMEFELAKKINGRAPGIIAKIACESGVPIIHYSTDYVFDGEKGEYQEDDRPAPISNYGRSKLIGEEEVRDNCDEYYIIRTSKLFGKKGSSDMAKKSFFETMIVLAKDNASLKIVDDEKSCFTYTPDLAEATKKIIESHRPFGTYHIVNENPCTWYEAARELFRLTKIKIEIIPVGSQEFPRPAKRPRSSVLLNTKFDKLRTYTKALEEYLGTLQ